MSTFGTQKMDNYIITIYELFKLPINYLNFIIYEDYIIDLHKCRDGFVFIF